MKFIFLHQHLLTSISFHFVSICSYDQPVTIKFLNVKNIMIYTVSINNVLSIALPKSTF